MLTVPPLELPAGRARLEPLTVEHAEALLGALDDAACWAYFPWARPRSGGDMRAYIESALALKKAGSDFPFAVIDRSTGKAAGTTRYCDIQPLHRHVEIGWTMIGPAVQRTSVNTECKYLLLRHAFETLDFGNVGVKPGRGCLRVTLKTDGRNERSQKAILRIGAAYEGTLRQHRVMPDGYVRDSVCYSVIAQEWPTVKSRLESLLARGSVQKS